MSENRFRPWDAGTTLRLLGYRTGRSLSTDLEMHRDSMRWRPRALCPRRNQLDVEWLLVLTVPTSAVRHSGKLLITTSDLLQVPLVLGKASKRFSSEGP